MKLKTVARSPLVLVGGQVFIDLLANFGEEFSVEDGVIERMISTAQAGDVVLARRLDRRELARVKRMMQGAEHEVVGHLLRNDDARWTCPRRGRRS